MINHKCQQIEELLIRQTYEELSEQEVNILNNHLEKCSTCRDFKISLTKIQKDIKCEAFDTLNPDPAIHKKIITKIKLQKQRNDSRFNEMFNSLFMLLKYRVPVYQAALVAILILFIFNITLNSSFFNVSKKNTIHNTAVNDSYNFESNYLVSNFPSPDSQNVGINAKEDTIFTRFIYSSM